MSQQFIAPGPGPWELESTHFPRPLPRFIEQDVVDNSSRAFKLTTARYGLLLDYLKFATVNRWAYMQPVPYLAPEGASGPPPAAVLWLLTRLHPKMRSRIATSKRAFATKQWRRDLEAWDREDKPQAIRQHLQIQAVDVAALDDLALSQHLAAARAHLIAMLMLHHKYTGTILVVGGDYLAGAQAWTGAEPGELLELVAGTSPVSLGFAAEELAAAGEAIKGSATAAEAFNLTDASAALASLAADPAAGPAVTAYLDVVRYRSVGYDVGDPIADELPDQLIAALKTASEGRAERREPADPAAIRARVPAEFRADFDERLAEFRHINRLRDERGQYSDGWGTGLARRAILEVGRRLQDRGLLHDARHAVDLTPNELTDLLLRGTGPSADDVERHYTYRTSAKVADAPASLNGDAPPPPPVTLLPKAARRAAMAADATMHNLFSASASPNEDRTLRGLPVSPGRYIGTARLIDSPDDFGRLEQGDILVTRSTSPYFKVILPLLGAIVTDRGGQLSHAAIVAREFGIPAVVGTRDATTTIPDGATIEVDSIAGEVRLHTGTPVPA